MTTIYKKSGDVVPITAGGTITSNDYVLISLNLQGVAAQSVASGEEYELLTCGTYLFPKNTGANTDLTLGEKVLWDVSAGVFDQSATPQVGVDVYAGVAIEVAATTDATVLVKLFDRPEVA